jgi:DtxR family Mn-dependent transcriptional regulator
MIDPLFALLVASAAAAICLLLFWPANGLYWRWQEARRLTRHVLSEDALKHIYKCEVNGRRPTIASIAGALHISANKTAELLAHMQSRQLLQLETGSFQLTPAGRESALHIIRAHRLWERHLADETGFAEAAWHGLAERQEHRLSPTEIEALSARLGNPTHDPHGDPIPPIDSALISHGGQPLTTYQSGTSGRIVHLEDEPELVYAQLVAEGLHPGMVVRVIESSPERIRFWANEDEHMLAPLIAANISVAPTPEPDTEVEPGSESLTQLEPGETAVVTTLSTKCRGAERRRFMDLGILPGTQITAEFRSPGGDPVAYRIRGSLIALRQEQADQIRVQKESRD